MTRAEGADDPGENRFQRGLAIDDAAWMAQGSRYDVTMTPALRDWAAKYIWWQTPEEAALRPQRVMAQVMDLGTFADVRLLEKTAGPDALADVIRHAEPGWFSPRSWHFWHRRLGLARTGAVPAMPVRRFA